MRSKPRYLAASISAVIAGLTLGDATPVSAQGMDVLEEVIVTARKKDESLHEIPLTVNAFTSDMLEERGIESLENLAGFTPGFDFAQAFGRQDFRPAIRGQSNIQGGANAGLFVEGVFIGEGGPTLPYGAMQRVEVIKGPQSALFGRSTVSGAVNYILKDPTDEFQGDMRVSAGEDGYVRTEATFSGPITDQWGYMVSGSYYSFDGTYENNFVGNELGSAPFQSDLGGEETTSFVGVLQYSPNDTTRIKGRLMYEDSSDDPYAIGLLSASNNNCFQNVPFDRNPGDPGTPDDAFFISSSSAYNGSGYFCGDVDIDDVDTPSQENQFYNDMGTEFEAIRVSLTADWEMLNHSWSSTLAYNDYDNEARQDQGFGAVAGDVYMSPDVEVAPGFFINFPVRFGLLTDDEESSDETSFELRMSSSQDQRLRYMMGVYYYEFSSSGKGRSSDAAVVAYASDATDFPYIAAPDEERENWAVFGQLEYDITDALTGTIELRYNEEDVEFSGLVDEDRVTLYDEDDTFDEVLPRFTLRWDVNDDHNFYGTGAKGNKPGDVNTSTGLRREQRLVDEETVWSYELGLKSFWMDKRITTNLALFYIDWDDQQLTSTTTRADGSGAFSILENVGETEISGVELEVNASVTDWWNVYLGYSYTDSEIQEYTVAPAWLNIFPGGYSGLSGYKEPNALGNPFDAEGNVVIEGSQLPQTSEHQLTVSHDFRGQLTSELEWLVRVDYMFNSERYAQVYNEASTDDRHIVNMRTGITSANFDLELWADNVFDDDTPTALIRYIETQDGFWGPNRAIGVTLPKERLIGVTARYRF